MFITLDGDAGIYSEDKSIHDLENVIWDGYGDIITKALDYASSTKDEGMLNAIGIKFLTDCYSTIIEMIESPADAS